MPPSYEQLKFYLNEPACENFMKALADCNSENPWMRFLGTCDVHSEALNKCISAQKEARRPKLKLKTNAKV